jgi:protein-tyrosine phosphatase
MRQPFRILFVCTGNMCRSPLCERLARGWLTGSGVMSVDVSSAGTHAVAGAPIYADSEVVLRRLGGDPAGFIARQLTPQIAAGADLILTAARPHREFVRDQTAGLCPDAVRRTFTLREFAALAAVIPHGDISRIGDAAGRARALTAAADPLRGRLAAWPQDRLDVPDPVGQPMAVHEATAAVIAEALAGPLGLIAGTPGARNAGGRDVPP